MTRDEKIQAIISMDDVNDMIRVASLVVSDVSPILATNKSEKNKLVAVFNVLVKHKLYDEKELN